jgi:hypothetical protein
LAFAFRVANLVEWTVGGLLARRVSKSRADALLCADLVVAAIPISLAFWAQEWLTALIGVADGSLLAVLVLFAWSA